MTSNSTLIRIKFLKENYGDDTKKLVDDFALMVKGKEDRFIATAHDHLRHFLNLLLKKDCD